MQSIKTLWAYLKSPLVKSKTAAASDEATVKSLSFMATTLLIIGLTTSWLAIAPFIFSVVASFAHPIFGFIAATIVCLLISLLCDKPLGVFIPQFFDKITNSENYTPTGIAKIISLLVLSVSLSLVTMNLSSKGGTLTAKMLFEDKRPTQNGAAVVQNDNLKRTAIAQIRASYSKELEAAKALDKAILDKSAKAYETADYNAKKQFPQYKSHNWHKEEYNKAMQKAHQVRTTAESYATNYTTANQKLSGAIYETTTAFETKAAIDAENYKTKLADYERNISVANALLRDLGYYSTPLLFFVCGLMVVMGLKDGKGKVVKPSHELDADGIAQEDVIIVEDEKEDDHTTKARKVSELKKYWSQSFQRLQSAIETGGETSTPAKNILKMYSDIRDIGEDFYTSTLAQAKVRFGKLSEPSELLKYAN